jgi:threonine/homoserine/homoserine lactone efflux protein
MTIQLWAAYALTELTLSLMPGPAVLFVASQGTQSGARGGMVAALGVVVGNSVYFGLSALGLGSLLLASATVFGVLRWVGVAYLVLLGARLILRKESMTPAADAPPTGSAFARGMVTQLANPKALVFFTAVLPPFVTPGRGAAMQFAILGTTSIVVEYPVLVLYAWVAGRVRCVVSRRMTRWRDRFAGALLVSTGARLALSRPL